MRHSLADARNNLHIFISIKFFDLSLSLYLPILSLPFTYREKKEKASYLILFIIFFGLAD